MKTSLTIGGVLLLALSAWMARITELVTDDQLIHAFISTAVVVGFTLLAWVWGAGLTELQKRLLIPRPWTKRAAQKMFAEEHGEAPANPFQFRRKLELFAQAEKSAVKIYIAAVAHGGVTLVITLAMHFSPTSWLGWLLTMLYGLGVGGLLLPTLYAIAMNVGWPRLRALSKRRPEIQPENPPTAP